MDERDINRLFERVNRGFGVVPDAAEKVFSMLVSSTLAYRDRLKSELGIVLTVEDVRTTLDWLLHYLQTNRMPETENAIRRDLLIIWQKALTTDLNSNERDFK